MGVSIYSTLLAKKMSWTTEKTRNLLAVAGFLHDIGKKNLPQELKEKNFEDFTESDTQLWENHVIYGVEELTKLESVQKEILQIVMQHHEYLDGTGYPFGLTNVHLYPLAKVVTLVDTFTNLVMPPDKKEGMSPEKAINYMIKEYDHRIDKVMMENFKEIIFTN